MYENLTLRVVVFRSILLVSLVVAAVAVFASSTGIRGLSSLLQGRLQHLPGSLSFFSSSSSSSPGQRHQPTTSRNNHYWSGSSQQGHNPPSMAAATTTSRMPVYFFSHGGPNVQYETEHPAYAVLQKIGKEITGQVKPKAVVVFSAHWEAGPDSIQVNTAEKTNLIYDFYGFPDKFYQAKYPNRGDPQLANKIISLLSEAGIRAEGVTRGLDHGVWSGFHVAFDPKQNPLNVPIVQVSLYHNEDPDKHYALGRAVSSLRDEGVLIIGAGMTGHNLREARFFWGSPTPQPYIASFDDALKEAVEASPAERQARMRTAAARADARKSHPTMDHLMPVYIAAGAAGEDPGVQTWTLQESTFAWGQYVFGTVPRGD